MQSLRARNTAPFSDNKIHDDRVAAQYGFRGGLVPGVTVYGYMASAVVLRLSHDWLERGSMQVRFKEPTYEGDDVIVQSNPGEDGEGLNITAARSDGTLCATGSARILHQPPHSSGDLVEHPLPVFENRPPACWDAFVPGAPMGTLHEKLDLTNRTWMEELAFDPAAEPSPMYTGPSAVAHPAVLLGFSNRILSRNFKLGPWIHVGSELTNLSTARHGDEITVTGRIHDRFERKGHEFVVLDVAIDLCNGKPVQRVRHTAIYLPKPKSAGN
jgi:acyl dehydratase